MQESSDLRFLQLLPLEAAHLSFFSMAGVCGRLLPAVAHGLRGEPGQRDVHSRHHERPGISSVDRDKQSYRWHESHNTREAAAASAQQSRKGADTQRGHRNHAVTVCPEEVSWSDEVPPGVFDVVHWTRGERPEGQLRATEQDKQADQQPGQDRHRESHVHTSKKGTRSDQVVAGGYYGRLELRCR